MARKTAFNPAERERRFHVGERRRAHTRARLLAAAYKLFALHGAEAPTIDDVIVEAGVARGTFYNYFKTRDSLFRAVADDIATSINHRLDLVRTGMADPAERVTLGFRVFARYATADATRGWILLRTMPLLGGISPGMSDDVTREFTAAFESGRFRSTSATMMIDLALGFLIRIIYRLLVDRLSPDYVDHATEAMLIAFGLDPAEARILAFKPLPVEVADGRAV